ncbi:hypothetical protein VTN96DRAFT_4755 [Rasamsonia emersonii]
MSPGPTSVLPSLTENFYFLAASRSNHEDSLLDHFALVFPNTVSDRFLLFRNAGQPSADSGNERHSPPRFPTSQVRATTSCGLSSVICVVVRPSDPYKFTDIHPKLHYLPLLTRYHVQVTQATGLVQTPTLFVQ